ncbi:piercer of microtubule wall 1 protein [Emydura macquarii macquarii]|uniref:piercer of microtubule wall 1 protein n=1 Tax=Emydura macquarii macquarii TaxID=1129001 RepID=UPI003529EFAD
MSQEHLLEASTTCKKEAEEGQRTSDYYRVSDNLPARFNHPGCFRGYRTSEPHPMYRTTNQTYGSKAPTVHEMPTSFNICSHAFSKRLGKCGMYMNNGLNTYMEKSDVTGIDNFITFYDRFNFHPSYNGSGPSHCE